ncbi:Protein gts1 [Entomophthora muscae]|uniref:Protein gts1 n=1 Tax=Entomophthora muscae TaxID=34485 RepID=A0ACC2S327_9FUNG|nr:Protein gts1 [Entomophthora muscae]
MSNLTEKEKKRLQELNEQKLLELVREKGNNTCCDCGASGPRWASFNLGCFLCIRCGGIHRRMGTHISKVRSISLDKWTPEQIQNMEEWGNIKVNSLYLHNAGSRPIPTDDEGMEQYIRDKYERQRFLRPGARTGSTETRVSDEYASSLKVLHDMGFTDMERNRKALVRAKTVSAAIELMVNESDFSPPKTPSMDPRLAQLKAMGFEDQARNIVALRQSKGSVEQAIELLISQTSSRPTATSPKASAVLGISSPPKPSRDDDFGDFASAFAPPEPKNDLSDLVFSSDTMAQTPAPVPKKDDKDYIMSLFAANPPHSTPARSNSSQMFSGLSGLNFSSSVAANPSGQASIFSTHNAQTSPTSNNTSVSQIDSAFAALDPFSNPQPFSQNKPASSTQPNTPAPSQDLLDLL